MPSLGNYSRVRSPLGNVDMGTGVRNTMVGDMAWIGTTMKAGSVLFLPFDYLYGSQRTGAKAVVQSVGGSIELTFTLQNPALSCNRDPNVQASVSWANATTLAPGTITEIPVTFFAAMRVVFTNTAEFYFMGR